MKILHLVRSFTKSNDFSHFRQALFNPDFSIEKCGLNCRHFVNITIHERNQETILERKSEGRARRA